MLSRRLTVLVALVVVVLALGIIGLLGAVGSASPDDDHNDKGRTLTVLTKTREEKVVDLGPQGPSHGDMRVVNAPLYDASGKERIGRLDLFCVLTDPADKPDEKAQMTECMRTYTLPGGEIVSEGVTARSSLNEPQFTSQTDAVSGGTGEYAGVRGEVHFVMRGNTVISTFHFIG